MNVVLVPSSTNHPRFLRSSCAAVMQVVSEARHCSVGCSSGELPAARPNSPKVSKLKVSVMTRSVGANSSPS